MVAGTVDEGGEGVRSSGVEVDREFFEADGVRGRVVSVGVVSPKSSISFIVVRDVSSIMSAGGSRAVGVGFIIDSS
jgi:hypothetical protein